MFAFALEASDSGRFRLLKTHHNYNNKKSTGIYYDPIDQRIISKTYSWNNSFESYRQGQNSGFVFPKVVNSFAEVSPEAMDAGYNINVSYGYHPLNSSRNVKDAKSRIAKIVGSGNANVIINTAIEDINQNHKNYKLVTTTSKGDDDLAVYYNEKKGSFLFKSVDRDGSGTPKYQFPRNISFQQNVSPDDNRYDLEKNKEFPARTMFEFNAALTALTKEHDRFGILFNNSPLDQYKSKLREKMNKFVLIKQTGYRDRIRKVFYNFDTNQIIYQETKKNSNGQTYLMEENTFSLNNEKEFSDAKYLLAQKNVIHKEQFNNFRDTFIGVCSELNNQPLLNLNQRDISNITDRLFEQYLQSAVSDSLIQAENMNIISTVNILDNSYKLSILYDDKGKIKDVRFLNAEKAGANGLRIELEKDGLGDKHFHLRAIDPSDEQLKSFIIVTSEAPAGTGSSYKGKLILNVRGKKGQEDFTYNGFEKNIYDINLNSNLNQIITTGKRIRLKGDNRKEYDVKMKKGGSGGFLGVLFKTFYSKNAQFEAVKENIAEKAGKTLLSNKDFKYLTNQAEIDMMAEKIAKNVKLKTNNYSSSLGRIEAVAATESYSVFGELLLRRTIANMLPTEKLSTVQYLVDEALNGFKNCLARADAYRDKRNADKCMEAFESEAPVDLGRAILELKLKENGMGGGIELARKEYNKCIKEKYDPVVKKLINELAAPTNIIKNCTFRIILESIDKNTELLIDQKLAEVDFGDGTVLSLSKKQKADSINVAARCYKEKGLADKNSYTMIFDDKYLTNIDPTKFEQDMTSCVDKLTLTVGRYVTEQVILAKVTGAVVTKGETLTNENLIMIESVVSNSIINGYDYCTNIQQEIISEEKERYNQEKKRLEQLRAFPNQGVVVNIYVPKFDPELCSELLSTLSISEVAINKISNMMGPRLWSDLTEGEDIPRFLKCFENRKKTILNNFKDKYRRKPLYLNFPDEQQLNAKLQQRKDEVIASDPADAKCLKSGIIWGSSHLTKTMLQGSLKEMETEFGVIPITDEELTLLASKVQKCFTDEYANKLSISQVSNSLKPITDICSIRLLKDDKDFKTIVLKPIMLISLKEAKIEDKDLEKMSVLLLEEFSLFLNDQNVNSMDDFKIKSKLFKPVAVIKVMAIMIEEKLDDLVKGQMSPEETVAFKEKMIPLIGDLISNGSPSLAEQLNEAYANKDKETVNEIIAEFKINATKVISPEVIKIESLELVKQGIIPDDKLRPFLDLSNRVMKTCLNQISTSAPNKVDQEIDRCTSKVKEKGTIHIASMRIKNEFESPTLNGAFSSEVEQELLNEIMSDKFKQRAKQISLIKDTKQSEIAIKLLISDLKIDASKIIVKRLIPKTLAEIISLDSSFPEAKQQEIKLKRNIIANNSSQFFLKCMDEVKRISNEIINTGADIILENGEKFDSTNESNKCINFTGTETTAEILNYKLKEGLRLLSSNIDRNQILINKELRKFKQCSNEISPYLAAAVFTDELDGCLSQTIMDVAISGIDHLHEIGSDIITPNSETTKRLDICFKSINGKLVDKFKLKAPDNPLLLQTIEKLSSYTHKEQLVASFRISREIYQDQPEEKISIFSILSEVKKCAYDTLLPNLVDEYKTSLFANQGLNLNVSQKRIVDKLFDKSLDIISMKDPEGNRVTFNTKINGRSTSSTTDSTMLELTREYTPMIMKYLKQFQVYDNEGLQDEIDEVMEAIKADVIVNGYNLDINRVINIILESKLSDRIIKGYISEEIKTSAKASLSGFITNSANLNRVISKLSSKSMINRIFSKSDPDTKRLFDNIKNNYLRKVLNGTHVGSSPSRLVMWPLKLKLANDTKIGGFAETILAPIAQEELTEAKDSFSGGFGRLIGRVNSRDFTWSRIRNRSGGKSVVKNFSANILKPMLTYGLSSDKMNKAKEKLGDKISDLVKNNGEDYNPLW